MSDRPPAPPTLPPPAPRPSTLSGSSAPGRTRSAYAPPTRARAVPNAARIVRRARLVRWSKLALPVLAVLLLGSIALWPEIQRQARMGHAALRQDEAVMARTGVMVSPHYHGVDGHDRPFLITAASAHQVSPDRVDLVRPKADVLSASGTWAMATGDTGVYAPRTHLLDLAGHVVLYRADGTILTTPVATLDVRRNISSSPDWVHIEGPFGVIDAQRSFLATADGVLQFGGPARLVLNQTSNGDQVPVGGVTKDAGVTKDGGSAAAGRASHSGPAKGSRS